MAHLLILQDSTALARNNFSALRLGMALLVLWSHCFALFYGNEDGEPLSILLAGTYNSGNIGVLAFFAISGFLITLSYTRTSSWRSFLRRRVARIYPGYLVATLFCSLLVVPAFSTRAFGALSSSELHGLLSNLLLRNYIITSNAFSGGPVNGALWSIPYEFWCYLGVMAIGHLGLINRRLLFPAVAILLILVKAWLDMTGRRPGGGALSIVIGWPYLWFTVLPPFMLGASVYHYRNYIPRSVALLAALCLSVLVAAHLPIDDPLRTVVTNTLMPFTLCYAIFFLAFSCQVRLHGIDRYGDFSYGLYLYAFPIQQMLAFGLRGQIGFLTYVALSLLLTFGAAVLSWYLVERWFLTTSRRSPTKLLEREAAFVAP